MAPYSATGAQSEKFIAMSRRVPPEKGPRLSYGFKALADGGGARPQDGRATPRPPAAGPERRCRSGALRHPRTYGETRCIQPCMPKTKDRDSPPQSGHGDPCARAGSVPGDAAQGGNTDLAPRPACCQAAAGLASASPPSTSASRWRRTPAAEMPRLRPISTAVIEPDSSRSCTIARRVRPSCTDTRGTGEASGRIFTTSV